MLNLRVDHDITGEIYASFSFIINFRCFRAIKPHNIKNASNMMLTWLYNVTAVQLNLKFVKD